MTSLTFTIPGRPQPKERPRIAKIGRVYTPRSTSAYELAVRTYALQARSKCGWSFTASDRFRVRLGVYFPDDRRRDLDNAAKAILDAANGMLWVDDAHVVELHLYRGVDRERPRVDVVVTRMDPVALRPLENGGAKAHTWYRDDAGVWRCRVCERAERLGPDASDCPGGNGGAGR